MQAVSPIGHGSSRRSCPGPTSMGPSKMPLIRSAGTVRIPGIKTRVCCLRLRGIREAGETGELSSIAYGVLVAKREAAPRRKSTRDVPPGVRVYVDAALALIPAEALFLHAVILSLCSASTSRTTGGTYLTDTDTLKWVFWALPVLTAGLFFAGRWQSLPNGLRSPNIWVTIGQGCLPPLAFVAWIMLQRVSAFNAVDSSLDGAARDAVALIAASVLAVIASGLSNVVDGLKPVRA